MPTETEGFGQFVLATPPAPTLTGSEVVPCVPGSTTNQTTTGAIAALATTGTNVAIIATITATNTPITAGTGGPVNIGTFTAPPLNHMCTVIATIEITATDAGALVTPSLNFTDPTGAQNIAFHPFNMSTAVSQSYTFNFIGTGTGGTEIQLNWVTATGTGTLTVGFRMLDNGP
jgi:hypothetical protein